MNKCKHGCIKDACAMCRVIAQRDQLREALDFMVAQFGVHDCPAVSAARAALKATEEG